MSTAARHQRSSSGLVFPGGGIFFWFQAGAISALAKRFELGHVPCAGASAGALASTLAVSGCDMEQALDRALQLSRESGALDRGTWGLYGIWGSMIHQASCCHCLSSIFCSGDTYALCCSQWLDDLLPVDAHRRCCGNVCLLINQARQRAFSPNDNHETQRLTLQFDTTALLITQARLDPFGLHTLGISEFSDRSDLIAGSSPHIGQNYISMYMCRCRCRCMCICMCTWIPRGVGIDPMFGDGSQMVPVAPTLPAAAPASLDCNRSEYGFCARAFLPRRAPDSIVQGDAMC